MIADMGFTSKQARKALRETVSSLRTPLTNRMVTLNEPSSGCFRTPMIKGKSPPRCRVLLHRPPRLTLAAHPICQPIIVSKRSFLIKVPRFTLVITWLRSDSRKLDWRTARKGRTSGYCSMMRRW
jgi:hypothetical protein